MSVEVQYDGWQYCLTRLRGEIPLQQFNTWIRPLKVVSAGDSLVLAAPNRFIRDFVETKYGDLIGEFFSDVATTQMQSVSLVVSEHDTPAMVTAEGPSPSHLQARAIPELTNIPDIPDIAAQARAQVSRAPINPVNNRPGNRRHHTPATHTPCSIQPNANRCPDATTTL